MWAAQILGFLCLVFPLSEKAQEKHDFHTSLTEMRYNGDTKAFEITIRVFSDDLEDMVKRESGNKTLALVDADEVIEAYVKKNFAFVKGKDVVFGDYLGKESEDDVTWLYLELNEGKRIEIHKILNTIFLDYFDDQKNLLNVLFKKERSTLIFSSDERLQAFPISLQ